MARDRKTIKKELTDAFIADPIVIATYGLTVGLSFEEQFSLTSIENVWFDNMSFGIHNHELIVSENALNSRPHNQSWYKSKCLNYRDGLELVWILTDDKGNGYFDYDLTGILDAEERKIIDRVAVLESLDGELVIKVATDNAGTIEPLSAPQLTRFANYLSLIKDAGNRIRIINQPADLLKMTLNVYVDVSIIDLSNGKLLNVTEDVYPVEDAIKNYLENLEFNGGFVKEFFKNELKKAKGVKLPLIELAEWKYATFYWAEFGEWKVPEAGYFKIEPADLTINYLAYGLA
jgi:hypothetical protein